MFKGLVLFCALDLWHIICWYSSQNEVLPIHM